MHGPFIRPFLWLPRMWLAAFAACHASPFGASAPHGGPARGAGMSLSAPVPEGRPRHAALARLSWAAGTAWVLATGIMTGPSRAVTLLLVGGWLLAGTHAHEAADRRRSPAPPPAMSLRRCTAAADEDEPPPRPGSRP